MQVHAFQACDGELAEDADGFNAMQREIGRAQGVFLRLIADP